MFAYLDLAGFRRRSTMPAGEIDYVEQDSPGYFASREAIRRSEINGRLRKRYGNAGNRASLPFGLTPPALAASPSSAPNVQLQGRPTVGSIQIVIQIVVSGLPGTATFQTSYDDGQTWTTPQATASNAAIDYGLTAVFEGTYAAGDTYYAPTPVPEIILGWLTTMLTYDVYRKRGVNPQDPQIELLAKELEGVEAAIREAADSNVGLWDVATNDGSDSAIVTGGPLGHSQTSPYVAFDIERARGVAQDRQDGGGWDDD